MIPRVEVAQSHEALINDIVAAETSATVGAFWWLGQHSFIVKVAGKVFYIDPFFAAWESRQTPPLLTPETAKLADYILVTHGHGDHLCPESLAGMVTASPKALFLCPKTEKERLKTEAGVPEARIHALTGKETFETDGLKISAIIAKHEFFDEHPELGNPYLGYVVQIGELSFYHAGDTIPYDGLFTTLQGYPRLNVVFLPINGRDAERFSRNCAGNLTFQESVELAGDLKVHLAVPSHYDMFVGNQENVNKFTTYLEAKYPDVPYWVGAAGSRVTFSAPI